MNEQTDFNTWQTIEAEVLRRIRTRTWKPGEPIPKETDLAQEFGCARTTVNRALRKLAQDGFLERKRRLGTRVALHPVGKTVLEVSIIRQEIEEKNGTYGYRLVQSKVAQPPNTVNFGLGLKDGARALNLQAVHLMDGLPYAIEDRWVCLDVADDLLTVDFSKHSANEWLLENVPYTKAQLAISSVQAGKLQQEYLNADAATPLLQLDRSTWNGDQPVTFVSLWYHSGYRLISQSSS